MSDQQHHADETVTTAPFKRALIILGSAALIMAHLALPGVLVAVALDTWNTYATTVSTTDDAPSLVEQGAATYKMEVENTDAGTQWLTVQDPETGTTVSTARILGAADQQVPSSDARLLFIGNLIVNVEEGTITELRVTPEEIEPAHNGFLITLNGTQYLVTGETITPM